MSEILSIPTLGPDSEPGSDLYATVRGALIARGYSLNRWCARHGVKRQWARQALLGEATGPAARRLVAELIEAALSGDEPIH